MTNYLILFDDSSLCNKRIDELQKTMNDSCDVINYDLEDDGIYSIIDELTTISLFDEPKFLIVKTFEAISKISENALNELLRAMNDVNSNNVLVLFICAIVSIAVPIVIVYVIQGSFVDKLLFKPSDLLKNK